MRSLVPDLQVRLVDACSRGRYLRAMSDDDDGEFEAHLVAPPLLRCQECGRQWADGADRWRLYLTNDEPPAPLAYCPDCACREFET
jgi:hypothetical protein